MKKKFIGAVSVYMLVLLLFAGIASAHVVVFPKEAVQGSYEKFTVRVPSEKDVPTVKVEVAIPADVAISRFEPMNGWKYELTKDSTGKITSVLWTALGDGLSSTEFGEFNMQGKIGDKVTSITWKAHQTYKDGTVVDWTGAEEDKTPASVTKVNPVPANVTVASDGDLETTGTGSSSPNQLSLYLSIVALILAIITSLVSLRKKVK
jgi:uncharacterized protein YcnI